VAGESRPVLNDDLVGLWDMNMAQIDDVREKFDALEKIAAGLSLVFSPASYVVDRVCV
jgi:hypothetical protein